LPSSVGRRSGCRQVEDPSIEAQTAADSWLCDRRVVAKAEHGVKGRNPCFVVTTWWQETPEGVYDWYCQRGQVENNIKNFKRGMKMDRLSCSSYFANLFRLLLHAPAFRLMLALLAAAGQHSAELGRAEFTTLRLRLLKVAALVSRSVRRVLVGLPASLGSRPSFRRCCASSGRQSRHDHHALNHIGTTSGRPARC
jgi:hypothetical protein